MAEAISNKENSIQEYTVRFVGAQVLIDDTLLPLGQVSTEILNIDPNNLMDLYQATDALREYLTKYLQDSKAKDMPEQVKGFQERINSMQEIVFTIPPYSYMDLDKELARTIFIRWLEENSGSFLGVFQKGTLANISMLDFINSMIHTAHEISDFCAKVNSMLGVFFEPLPKRNAAEYARAAHEYYEAGEWLHSKDEVFDLIPAFTIPQTNTAMIEFVPIPDRKNPGKYVIAEQMVMHSIAEFLHLDLFRALIHGNAPRRCHNCGTYFLLTAGYNTCYCNNIAPGEAERTCRKVGAHKKEAEKGKSPIQHEYGGTDWTVGAARLDTRRRED